MRIWKYTLNKAALNRETIIEMPRGAEILCVKAQYNEPVIYVVCEPYYNTSDTRGFKLVYTGEDAPANGEYIGTVMLNEETLVVHVFELPVNEKVKQEYVSMLEQVAVS